MKKAFLLLFLMFCFYGFGQRSGTVTINWAPKKDIPYGEGKVSLPQFDAENLDYNGATRQLFYSTRIPETSRSDENSLQITNVTYEPVPASELGSLNISAIPSAINATLTSLQSRDKYFAQITISPIVRDASGYKRVRSFTYNFSTGSARRLAAPQAITNSVLAGGEWFRFFIQKSGVYIIDKPFLRDLGINVDAVDPRKIKIYGHGGRMAPLLNSTAYPDDLPENAIQVVGENDGAFNDGDHVLFYAEGVDNWNDESDTSQNLYTDKSYYYVNVQGAQGKRIQPLIQPSGSSNLSITTFDDAAYHETDLVNIGKLGRRWFGETFDVTNEQEFGFNIPNVVTATPLRLKVYTAATSLTSTSFAVSANGQSAGTINMSSTSTESPASPGSLTTTVPAAENVTIKLTYNNNGVPDSKGFLDYIWIKSKRSLRGYGKQFRFRYNDAASQTGIGNYQIANAGGIGQIWDITDIYNVSGFGNDQGAIDFKSNLGQLRTYIAIDGADLYRPQRDSQSRVANQNLKGTIFYNAAGEFKDVDYIIITPAAFAGNAERLAAFHRNYSQLNVKVVDLESIYQEFTSGKQDVAAIRNFVKYVYTNASAPDKRIKYLNMFGDASYDFKNRITIASNFVPVYHALNGYSLGDVSFCSDDFFAEMDDNEGYLDTRQGSADIAVGRMLAGSTAQADQLVTKVIEYHDYQSYGNWRNSYICVADDPDNASDRAGDKELQFFQNRLTDRLVQEKPFMNAVKILMDSYEQETSSGGNRYPKARRDMFNAFEKGALVFNYLGHGGEDGLAQERIWEKSDGQNLFNQYRYALFVTITCEFSRFDNPFRPTAGEYTYWNPHGGAISMLTTVRAILQSSGQSFNDVLMQYLFSYGSNQYVSIAEALRLAKGISPSRSTGIVFYLGDPALMLAIPKPKVKLTKVNGAPITGAIDDLKALSYVTLSGEVTDEFNNPLPAYNGELAVQIFDKGLQRTTLRNDGVDALVSYTPYVTGPVMPFNTLGETIFRGNASVRAGQFEFGFVVPRDITIAVGNGRASFYSKRTQILLDKAGFDTTIRVGGINENAPADNTGPTVRLYMNDETFVSGGITNESPIFLAFLQDEHGINTASGIGHDIVAILDGDENNPYKLNDYYETELDNYKNGKLKYPFRNLSVGLHTILFKAWDVYNNLVTAEIQFIVVGNDDITLTNVLNYPNPFVNYTQFWFSHNRPFEPLEVQVQVMTITGKIVWTKNQTVTTQGFLSRDITWDGKDDFGDRIGKGVYVYKLTVRSLVSNSKAHKFEKLVIL